MEDGAVSASASTRVTIVSQPAVGVAIIGTAPGVNDVLPRGACVTIALAAGAASECGDLRLAHGAAPIITMGSVRAPTLLYNSQHARPLPSVIATVRLSSSVALPPNVTACIKVANVSRGCQTWPGTAWGAPGNTRQIVVQGTSGTWTTGRVDYTLEVTTSNGNQPTYTATGRLYIVNRATSRYGAGWWLAGLEQLKVVHADTLVWIGGDGSARRYLKTGSVWMPSNFATRDSIIAVAGGRYARLTAEHARVYFNSAGRHDSTVNSVRHVTRFEYAASTDSLLRIRVPRPSGGFADFTFAYLGGKLDSISSPGGFSPALSAAKNCPSCKPHSRSC